METVDVKLPWELLRVANLEGSSLSQEAARLLALELYREDKVSQRSTKDATNRNRSARGEDVAMAASGFLPHREHRPAVASRLVVPATTGLARRKPTPQPKR